MHTYIYIYIHIHICIYKYTYLNPYLHMYKFNIYIYMKMYLLLFGSNTRTCSLVRAHETCSFLSNTRLSRRMATGRMASPCLLARRMASSKQRACPWCSNQRTCSGSSVQYIVYPNIFTIHKVKQYMKIKFILIYISMHTYIYIYTHIYVYIYIYYMFINTF